MDRAKGSGARGPTPLTRGSSRTMPAGTSARSARSRSARRWSSGSGIAWACTSMTPSVVGEVASVSPWTRLRAMRTPRSRRDPRLATVCRRGRGLHVLLTGRNAELTPWAPPRPRANLHRETKGGPMSWYQMHRAVYDWVRAGEVNSTDGGDGRSAFDVSAYELTDEERKAFENRDIAALYKLGL